MSHNQYVYTDQDGTNDYLRLPDKSEYLQFRAGIQNKALIHGAEYFIFSGPLPAAVQEHNTPCVVCCTSRVLVLMIPARVSCPTAWTLEYCGYLMTESTAFC